MRAVWKIKSTEELDEFKKRFPVKIERNEIIVTDAVKGYAVKLTGERPLLLKIAGKSFAISRMAISLWKLEFQDRASLFDVQNAILAAKLNKEVVTQETIEKYL